MATHLLMLFLLVCFHENRKLIALGILVPILSSADLYSYSICFLSANMGICHILGLSFIISSIQLASSFFGSYAENFLLMIPFMDFLVYLS